MGDRFFPSTKLLQHFDGVNGGTDFSDFSGGGHVFLPVGSSTLSTAQKKFGATSLFLSGAADSGLKDNTLRAGDNLGANDWTVEYFIYMLGNGSGWNTVCSNVNDAGNGGWRALITAPGRIPVTLNAIWSGGNPTTTRAGAQALPLNAWAHVAHVRKGNQLTTFVNGVADELATLPAGASIAAPSQGMFIGGQPNFSSRVWLLNAYLDDFRVTPGVARYTTNFTPATAPFPNAAPAFYDNYAAADGTSLNTHVADSGQSYASSPSGFNFVAYTGPNGTGARTNLLISGGKLGPNFALGTSPQSYAANCQVSAALPLDKVTISAVVVACATDMHDEAALNLSWPVANPNNYKNTINVDTGGYLFAGQTDTPNSISSSLSPDQLIWVPGSLHQIDFVIGAGQVAIYDNGALVTSGPWVALQHPADAAWIELQTYDPTGPVYFLDSLEYDGNSLAASPSAVSSPTATGIAPTTTFGTPTNRRTQTATAIASASAFGAATSKRTQAATAVASTLAFGTATNKRTQPATGSVSTTLGTPVATATGAPALLATGLASTVAIGTPAVRLTLSATALAARTAFGTPKLPSPFTFTESFTDAANTALSAHVADSGQAWSDPNGAYALDSTGQRLVPCFNQNTRAGTVGYATPVNAVLSFSFQPPTTGTNPFQVIVGAGNTSASSITGAAGVVYAAGGSIQIRWFISAASSILLGQMTKAELGFGVATVNVQAGKITVNSTEFLSDQIALPSGNDLVLNLYSNTSTANARPYLESLTADVMAATNLVLSAMALSGSTTYGTPTAEPTQIGNAASIDPTTAFGAPSGAYTTAVTSFADGIAAASAFGAATAGMRQPAIGAQFLSMFGYATTPVQLTLSAVATHQTKVGHPTAFHSTKIIRNRLLRAKTIRATKYGLPKASR